MTQNETTQSGQAFCHGCGAENPTRFVDFRQQIGLFVTRRQTQIRATLCKQCIKKTFWRYTLITAIFGWWGVIAFFLTPIFLLNNIYYFLRSLSLPATSAKAGS